ncbi:hypothetical protein [Pseudolysinimonas sp.]|uniref:hypothetical protein n=1 Tax=Pseudolysinimonas sp. TaxID=2680009 RepID=UPI003F7F40AF
MSARPVVAVVAAAGLAAAVALLTGCAAAAPSTTTAPSRLAATVAASLKYPTALVECGTEKVAVRAGGVARCRLTEGDKVYAVTVRFSSVKGTHYRFDARVASTPMRTLATPKSVGGDAVAQLAAQALAPKIGFTPQLACADGQVPLTVGFVERCRFAADDGDHVAEVTLSAWDGSTYSVTAKVVS